MNAVELTRSIQNEFQEEEKETNADEWMTIITREAARAMSMPGASSETAADIDG